jgi:hypothetical protein
MTAWILTKLGTDARLAAMRTPLFVAAAILSVLPGCVQVSAPDKPIEINLNINIRQEVVVRLQKDVSELIKENPGVF